MLRSQNWTAQYGNDNDKAVDNPHAWGGLGDERWVDLVMGGWCIKKEGN